MDTGLLSVPVPSWSIVSLALVPSTVAVTKSLKLEVALYPTNKSLRSIMSALVFVFVVMTNTVFTTDLLNELITNGNLVLE
jgi:hypothetical protein